MYFKKVFRILAAVVAGLILAAVSGSGRAGSGNALQETVNCVAAVVNAKIITLTDVRIAEAFGLVESVSGQNTAERRRAVLDKLIDLKVIIDLARENVPLDPAKTERALADILARLGPDTAKRRLEEFGLAPADLLPAVEEKILGETIVAERFGRSAGVSLQDIERYYAETYVPEQKKTGAAPKPLFEVLPTIEDVLKKAKIAGQAALWVKNLRGQAEIEIRADCIK